MRRVITAAAKAAFAGHECGVVAAAVNIVAASVAETRPSVTVCKN